MSFIELVACRNCRAAFPKGTYGYIKKFMYRQGQFVDHWFCSERCKDDYTTQVLRYGGSTEHETW